MKENKRATEIYNEKQRGFAIPVFWHVVVIVAESCSCSMHRYAVSALRGNDQVFLVK